MALRPLSRDGKVYRLDSNPMVRRVRNGAPDVRLDGINRASTFYGFCRVHDAALFRPIDLGPFEGHRLQAALLLIRAIAHEMSKKEMADAVADFLRERIRDVEWADDLQSGTQWAQTALQEHLNLLQDALEQDLGRVVFNAFVSDEAPRLVSSIVWWPDFDFEGKPIQRIPQTKHLPGLVGIFSMPHPTGSLCVVAWHQDSQWCADRLLGSLARSRPVDEIGDALLQLQMAVAENVFFVPDWWDGLNQSTRDAYFDWWRQQGNSLVPPDPQQANRLRLPDLRWPIHYVHRA